MVFSAASRSSVSAKHAGSTLIPAVSDHNNHVSNSASFAGVLFQLWTGLTDPDGVQDPAAYLPPHGVDGFEPTRHRKQEDAVLFREEDLIPWTVFTVAFFVLVIFDNFVLHRKVERPPGASPRSAAAAPSSADEPVSEPGLSLLQSLLYTTFWISVAGMFNVYVLHTRGVEDALNWGTGYILEWMLSVDNLFVFHRIFKIFKTPDAQKHKPLFYGIVGAIFFRMLFFLIGEVLLHHIAWMHLVFGVFLIYTGIKAVSMDDDEDDPEKGWMYNEIIQYINYVDEYDEDGRFFIQVKEYTEHTGREMVRWKATRLVLVVICLEVTDLVFAVDSVSAIIAQIPDLFLAYTACVFAMLGLRALFFAIDKLVEIFSLLSYGVAAILIFIGIKLIFKSWIHIPPGVVCCVLIGTLLISILASLLHEKFCSDEVPKEVNAKSGGVEEGVAEDTDPPHASG